MVDIKVFGLGLLLKAAKKGQKTSNLEREYRDCVRDKLGSQGISIVNEEGDMHII